MRHLPLSDAVRHNIVRRLGFIFAASILAQFGAYVAFVGGLSASASLAPPAIRITTGLIVLVLRIVGAVPLGFFAARLTYRAMRRTLPPATRMPVRPVVVASAAAAGIEFVANIAVGPVLWSTIARDLLAAALWIFAAYRALRRAT